MSVMRTARSRVVLVLVMAALLAATGYTARAGTGTSSPGEAGTETDRTAVEPVPEIGTALKMVRHADGTVTTTES